VDFYYDQGNASRSLWSPTHLLTFKQLYLYQVSKSSDPDVIFLIIYSSLEQMWGGDRGGTVAKVLCYKSEGR